MSALRLQDFRLTIRRLRKDTGSTIASVAALACSIGAGVATWSLLSAVLLKPLPVTEPDRLFQLDEPPPFPGVNDRWVPGHTYPDFAAFRDSGAFDEVVGSGGQSMPVLEQGDMPQRRDVRFVTHDFFATLGIVAARGRTFTEDEDRQGAPAVAVLSDRYWRSAFNADANVLGRTVTVSGTSATIIGILPRGFRGLHLSEAPDLYLPLQIAGDINYETFTRFGPLGPRMPWLSVVGRLRPDETPAAAAARLNALGCQCPQQLSRAETIPITLTSVNTAAIPELVRGRTTQFAMLLSVTVSLLLLVGCLTVGMLLLVRTEDRRDELAVRLALGATRSRLASSIVVEAAIVCALGAILALPVALWLFYGVRAFQLPAGIEIAQLELTLDLGAWIAVTGVALAATSLIALLASLVGVVAAVRSPVQSRALATPRLTRRAPRTVLVAGQVAITLVLVTGAGLFARSLIEALNLNPAIDTDRIVMAHINLGQHGYTPTRADAFIDELLERLRHNGAIESASLIRQIGGAIAGAKVTVDGVEREVAAGWSYAAVEPGYFSTIGLPLINGRGFDGSDSAGSPRVA